MADTPTIDVPDGIYEELPGWSGMIRHPDVLALTAGAYPVKPPSKWFENPQLAGLTPLTIEDDGRVYGHIAAWHTSHIGMAGGVKPPRSKSDYAYYKTGVVKCADEKMVNVGQITLTGGHAPLNVGVAKAVAHYDDTASAIMDVAAGEDKHGIWVAGALRPEVSDSQLRSIRASSVSGDWRPINGKLELVAVCAVNAPGFPIPRARVASGAPIALVAAGIEPLIEIAMQDRIQANVEHGISAGLELFRERVLRLENAVLAGGDASESVPEIDPEQLRRRVRGGSALAASLRERVRNPKPQPDELVEDVQALAASLRERVKGSDVDPKGKAPEALTAARKRKFNPLLHPRGADGRFIEKGSWVRWLHRDFGSSRRGEILDIIEVQGKPIAKVEFPEKDGSKRVYEISPEELERVAEPKGRVDDSSLSKLSNKVAEKVTEQLDEESSAADNEEIEKAVEEAVEETIEETLPSEEEDQENPSDEQLQAEEILDTVGDDFNLSGTPAVASDEWVKTTEWFENLKNSETDSAKNMVESLDPASYEDVSDWGEALYLARSRYEAWRIGRLLDGENVDLTLEEYLAWLESRGLRSSLVAALRADARVRGSNSILARATEYWTEERREKAAKSGIALPDGSYPISDKEDLRKAIQSYGRAKDPVATKRHIMRRASRLDSLSMIPDGWAGRKAFDPAKHLRGPDGRFAPQGKSQRASAFVEDITAEELRERVHRES